MTTVLRIAALLLPAVAVLGCQGSRWAKSDPVYAQKYPHHTGNLARMAKQAVDARHIAGRGGGYVSGHGGTGPAVGGAAAGVYIYPPHTKGAVETRAGLAILGAEQIPVGDENDFFSGGVDLGVRLQSPSRIAPFVGLGGYAGFSDNVGLTNDNRDNDDDSLIDEPGERGSELIGALYPEIGVHFWVTPAWRASLSARHYVIATERDSREYQTLGISLAWLNAPDRKPAQPVCAEPIASCPIESGWPNEASKPYGKAAALPIDASNPYAGLFIPAAGQKSPAEN